MVETKKKPTIIKAELIPESCTLRPSLGTGQYTYAVMKYRVWYKDEDDMVSMVEKNGPAIYLSEHPELELAFRVGIAALAEIEKVAQKMKYKG